MRRRAVSKSKGRRNGPHLRDEKTLFDSVANHYTELWHEEHKGASTKRIQDEIFSTTKKQQNAAKKVLIEKARRELRLKKAKAEVGR